MVKAYIVETRKRSYTAVGTSIRDVEEFIEENKRDLDLSFDMSGYYKVSLDRSVGMYVSGYTLLDVGLSSECAGDVSLRSGDRIEFVTHYALCELYYNYKNLITKD